MSKNPKPTAEELRFVYEMIAKGYDDNAILHEYCREYESGQLKFPFRTDKRFIRERRMEFEAASDMLKRDLKRETYRDLKQEHFVRMADIASSLLKKGLDSAVRVGNFYQIGPEGMGDIFYEYLPDMLLSNMKSACLQFSDYDVKTCFLAHLKAELNNFKAQEFETYVEEHTDETLETLRVIARRKTCKGVCPICKDLK
jgi:hypothetical protein